MSTPHTAGDNSSGAASPMRARRVRWAGVAVWASIIFAMSSIPGSNVPGRGGTLAHFVEYAVFGALLFGALRLDMATKRAVLLAVVIASGYAITDEFHQFFVPMRVPDPLDWVVDTAGAMAGALAASAVEREVRRRRRSVG